MYGVPGGGLCVPQTPGCFPWLSVLKTLGWLTKPVEVEQKGHRKWIRPEEFSFFLRTHSRVRRGLRSLTELRSPQKRNLGDSRTEGKLGPLAEAV